MNHEYERYKTDKLVDYLKFISSMHLAVIGAVITFREKFLVGPEIEIYFWMTIVVLFSSFVIVVYGYITLINSYFEKIKYHLKIAAIARKWPGYILVGSVTSFALQASSFWGG